VDAAKLAAANSSAVMVATPVGVVSVLWLGFLDMVTSWFWCAFCAREHAREFVFYAHTSKNESRDGARLGGEWSWRRQTCLPSLRAHS